jgi:thiol-disulfide isomerase/thioredoxin
MHLVSQQQGKVVLLNFWATWCPPCIEEFPDVVAVENVFKDRGLVVISVSADFPEKKESELLPFLAKHKPRFPVYIKRTSDPEDFVRRIDPEWNGAIPSTFFFDREGRSSVKRYSKMSREEIERILEALLEVPKD